MRSCLANIINGGFNGINDRKLRYNKARAALHFHGKSLEEQLRAGTAAEDAKSASTITSNVLRTVAITNLILETNQHAKQQIALESQRAASDIKTAVADDDCAVRIVPAGAVKRLHDYANGIRASSGGSATSQPDG